MKRLYSILALGCIVGSLYSQTSELIISEYIEGWSNNKALEIYNPTSGDIDLGDYRLVRYSNGEDVPPAQDEWTVPLPAVMLGAYKTFVVVIDQRDPNGTGQTAPVWEQLQQRADAFLCPDYNISETMYFNGDDAIVIEKIEGAGVYEIQDIFGRWGPPAPAVAAFVGSDKEDNAWTNVAPYVTGEGVAITAEHTMIRKASVTTGVTTNPSLFNPLAEYDTLPANTFNHLGWHIFANAPANETPVITNERFVFPISPSATNGTVVTTIEATDNEGDALKYYFDYGNFIYIDDVRIEPFSLDKNTGVISLVDETGLAPEVLDTFYIELSVTDGYSQVGPVDILIIVTDDTTVNVQNFKMKYLHAYPNPANDGKFRIASDKEIRNITFTNLAGQVIEKEEYTVPVFNKEFIFNNEKSGLYIITVQYSDGSRETEKLLVN